MPAGTPYPGAWGTEGLQTEVALPDLSLPADRGCPLPSAPASGQVRQTCPIIYFPSSSSHSLWWFPQPLLGLPPSPSSCPCTAPGSYLA